MTKKKKNTERTDDQAIKRMFPKEIVEEVKRLERDPKTPKKKPNR